MAFIYFDSCGDNIGTGTGALPGDWAATTNVNVSASGFTGNAFTNNSAAAWSASVPLMLVRTSVPFGFGMRIFASSLPASSGSILLIGGPTGTFLELDLTSAGALSMVNGPATASSTIATSTWTYVEIFFPQGMFIPTSTAVPSASIYVNGTLLTTANYTGATPNLPIVQAFCGQAIAGSANVALCTLFIDDFYCIDGTTANNNSPLGPQIVKIASPNGAGRVTQFTPTGFGSNWQCVSVIPPPGDTDYVSSSVVGTTDAYTLSTVTGISQLNGVKVSANARQTVAGGGRTLSIGLGNGTTENYGTPVSLTTSYVMTPVVYNTNPFNASPWTTGTPLTTLQAALQISS